MGTSRVEDADAVVVEFPDEKSLAAQQPRVLHLGPRTLANATLKDAAGRHRRMLVANISDSTARPRKS